MTGGIPEERAEGLVNMFLDDRLQDANEPPGLREAVTDRVSRRADDIGKRGGNRSASSGHRPVGASPTRTLWTRKSSRTSFRQRPPASGPRGRSKEFCQIPASLNTTSRNA